MNTIDAIARQEVLIKKLEKDQLADQKATEKLVADATKKTQAVDETAAYKNFRVSFEDGDGKEHAWEEKGPLTLADLTRHAAAVATTVATRLQGVSVEAAQRRKSRLEVIREFKHRSEDRATKMFHCRERIARLKAGDE